MGYANLRCVWVIGCPGELRPLEDEKDPRNATELSTSNVYAEAYRELFPGAEVPEAVGVSCCAQFSATRAKIQERPKSDYVRYLEWLKSTDLDDATSGRVFEYSWHSKHAVISAAVAGHLANLDSSSDFRETSRSLSRSADLLLRAVRSLRSRLSQPWIL